MRLPTIREEVENDIPAIRALTRAAFAHADHSQGNEQDIIDTLRRDGDLTLSLVATNMDEAVIGHIAFSPVSIFRPDPGLVLPGAPPEHFQVRMLVGGPRPAGIVTYAPAFGAQPPQSSAAPEIR